MLINSQFNPSFRTVRLSLKPSLFQDVRQCRLVVDYRRFGGNIGSNFKGQAVREECLTLEDEIDMLAETSVTKRQPTPRNIPEERCPQLHTTTEA